MLLLICVLAPVLGGLAASAIRDRTLRAIAAVAAACVSSGLVAWMYVTGAGERMELFRLTEGFSFVLGMDGLGWVYLGLAALLWPLSVLYAGEYMAHEPQTGHFFGWYLVSYGAAVLLSAAGNLFTLYICYELLTLCTVPLVAHKQDDASHRAALTYMLYLIGAGAMGFLAMAGLQYFFSLGDFAGQSAVALPENGALLSALALLGFFGFGAKAAVLPLCRWLPQASVAPTPVTALLHAVAVVNAGIFAVARLLYFALPDMTGTWAQTVMLAVSGLTVVYGAVRAVREQQVKRRLAWSTVSNLSYMLLGLCLLTRAGLAAGLSHMVFHGLMKIILFFCAGAVLTQTGRTQARQTQGLGRKMPLTFGAFALAGLSLMGVPPLPGFVSKYALVTAAFSADGIVPFLGGLALILSAVLTCVYIFTVVYPAFFMPPRLVPGEATPRDPGPAMRITLVILCVLLILAGIFAGRIMDGLTALAEGGMGG